MNKADYKLATNAHHRTREFKEEDYVMIRICPACYFKISIKSLHAGSLGPFLILRNLESNAYFLNFPLHITIRPIFNVMELFPPLEHQL